MKYHSGEVIELGDIVRFEILPNKFVNACVVLLGSDGSHLEICPEYLAAIKEINLVERDMIVTEYLDSDGKPNGNYLPTTILSMDLIEKGKNQTPNKKLKMDGLQPPFN